MRTMADFLAHKMFLRIAMVFACFFGVYGALMTGLSIHWREEEDGWTESERRRPWTERVSAATRALLVFTSSVAHVIFDFWFNAVGAFTGWLAVWFLWSSPLDTYGWRHLIVFIIAFAGVTGNLPHLSTGIREALVGLGRRVGGGGHGSGSE